MGVLNNRVVRWATISLTASACIAVYAVCSSVLRLPEVGSETQPKLEDLKQKRIYRPGKAGFWVLFHAHTEYGGLGGSDGKVTWMARKGLWPVSCQWMAPWKSAWGNPLSTIEGGSWKASIEEFKMEPKLYLHYQPVPQGTRSAIEYQKQWFIQDSATWAGDFHRIRI